MDRRTGKRRAFTLIELMIVVAIVGILAILAIYGVRKYLANAKTAEARNVLGQVAKDAASSLERESMQSTVLPTGSSASMSRSLCGTPATSVPAVGLSAVQGKKYQSDPADWNVGAVSNIGFPCLKFSMDQPQYYVYSYAAFSGPPPVAVTYPLTGGGAGCGTAGCSFVAEANGDLNGDGNFSIFAVMGQLNAQLELDISPSIYERNPEE